MERPVQDGASDLATRDPLWAGAEPLRTLGDVTVERMIAAGPSGSRGTVYSGRRDAVEVAAKVLRTRLVDVSDAERLQGLLAPLSSLEHPGLCAVARSDWVALESGPTRLAYLILEFVRGAHTLPVFVRRRGSALHERIALARTVAEALAHAHSLGVIHGDVRATRILVDETGLPKLTGFEAARVRSASDGAEMPADAHRDVQALGGVLYELLTRRPLTPGADPAPPSQVRSEVPRELDRIVLRVLSSDPAHRYEQAAELARDLAVFSRPSGWLSRARQSATNHRMAIGAAALTAAAAGAVFTGSRYVSHAAEIQRRDRAELERASTKLESVRTHLEEAAQVRERLEADAAELRIALQAGARNQSLLEERARQSEALVAFIERHFSTPRDPRLPSDPLFGDVLGELTGDLEPSLGRSPSAAALLRLSGRAFLALGDLESAESHLDRALSLHRELESLPGESDVLLALARVHRLTDRLASALEYAEGALALQPADATEARSESLLELSKLHLASQEYNAAFEFAQRSGELATEVAPQLEARALACQALVSEGQVEQAIRWGEDTHALALDVSTSAARRQVSAVDAQLGRAYALAMQLDSAQATLQRAVGATVELYGNQHVLASERRAALANVLRDLNRHAEATPHWQSVAQERDSRLGPKHPSALEAHTRWAQALFHSENWGAAAAEFERCVPLCRAELGMEHPLTVAALRDYGILLARTGSPEQSERFLRAAIQGDAQSSQSPDARDGVHAETVLELVRLVAERDELEEAEKLLTDALAGARNVRSELRISLRTELAQIYERRGRLSAATTELLDVVQEYRGSLGEQDPRTLRTELALARVLRRSGDSEGALHWARHVVTSLAQVDEDSSELVDARYELGRLLLLRGDAAGAADELRDVVEAWTSDRGADDSQTLGAARYLGRALLANNAAPEAEAMLDAALRAASSTSPEGAETRLELGRLRGLFGHALVALGRHAEAEQSLLTLVQGWDDDGADGAPSEAFEALADLYDELDQPALAAAYRARTRQDSETE